MKHLILAALVSIAPALGACHQAYESTLEAQAEVSVDAPVAAVLVFAEWCPSCKVLDPKVEQVRASLDEDAASFIRLDYTDRDEDAFFRQADDTGIGQTVRDHFAGGIRTGQLLLIETGTLAVVDTIGRSASIEDINDRILAVGG